MSNVSGVKEIKASIKVLKKAGGKGIERGLKRAGLFLQRESQKIVPIETGTLKGSADTRSKGRGEKTEVTVGYYDTDYAIYVHENLEARHKPGKQAKFLEEPLRNKRERLREIVAEEVAAEIVGSL